MHVYFQVAWENGIQRARVISAGQHSDLDSVFVISVHWRHIRLAFKLKCDQSHEAYPEEKQTEEHFLKVILSLEDLLGRSLKEKQLRSKE